MNMQTDDSTGYLELILGCMFSGKTSALVEIYKQYQLCDAQCLVINYAGDTRYSTTHLSTHDNKMIPCVFATKLNELETLEDDNHPLKNDVILINEGQFFPDLIDFTKKYVNNHNKKIYICGLDGDFKREKFGTLIDLIPQADTYRKLKAVCILCKNGTRASFTHRITKSQEQTIIGSDQYIPLCRKCYNQANTNN